MMAKFSLICFLVILGCAQQVLSLECYSCDSGPTSIMSRFQKGPGEALEEDEDDRPSDWCKDPYHEDNPSNFEPCGLEQVPGQKPVCFKLKYSIGKNEREVARSCANSTCKAITEYVVESLKGRVHSCDTCHGDLCNGAPPAHPALLSPLVALLLGAVLIL